VAHVTHDNLAEPPNLHGIRGAIRLWSGPSFSPHATITKAKSKLCNTVSNNFARFLKSPHKRRQGRLPGTPFGTPAIAHDLMVPYGRRTRQPPVLLVLVVRCGFRREPVAVVSDGLDVLTTVGAQAKLPA